LEDRSNPINFAAGVACWKALRNSGNRHPLVQLLGSGVCSVLSSKILTTIFTPKQTVHSIYRMPDGSLLDEWKVYEPGAATGTIYLHKEVRQYFTYSSRCLSYLKGTIGYTGIYRMEPHYYCSARVA
jgi:hypothetical protein